MNNKQNQNENNKDNLKDAEEKRKNFFNF